MSDSLPNTDRDEPWLWPEDIPDPNGEPVSLNSRTTRDKLVSAGMAAIAGSAGFLIVGSMMLPCVGATRSARLLRGQRQQEVAEALARFETAQQAESPAKSEDVPR